MPNIRNLALIKRFTEYFRLKANDMLDSEAGRMLVPVVNLPLPENIIQLTDIETNDSDKLFQVPDGKQWRLLFGHVVLTTSAVAGNRQMQLRLQDRNGNTFYQVAALNVQVASVVERYNVGQFSDVTESVATNHMLPIPVNVIIPEGFRIRFLDSAAVDPTADDMTMRVIVEERDLEDL